MFWLYLNIKTKSRRTLLRHLLPYFILLFNQIKLALTECRGRKEGKELMHAYKATLKQGTMHRDASFFSSVLAEKLIIQPKKDDVNGLQMSDLLVHPLKKHCLLSQDRIKSDLTPFARELCEVARVKYNRHYYNGGISGYGIIFL